MEGFQMPLFDTGEMVPTDAELQASRTMSDAYSDALKYGQIVALKCDTYDDLARFLNGFADGMAIAIGLNTTEREMVRNYAFAAADPIMQSKQH